MSDLPFLNPTILKQLDLPVPNRETTPQVLEPLDLSGATEISKPLQAYRKLYGLHLLDCEHWQGYVEMPLFRLHVQVFQPKQQKSKVPCVCYMVIWNIVVFTSRLLKRF